MLLHYSIYHLHPLFYLFYLSLASFEHGQYLGVSDTYRREVDIPFRSDSNPDLRDSTGVGTDIGACRSSGGTARRGRAVTFRSCSEVAQGICAVEPHVDVHVGAGMRPSERLLRPRCWRGPT